MSDLRDAFRALRATPIVTAVALLSLALGIGANTAIFSIVNTLMLRALPVREPQQLVQLLAGARRTSWSNPLWEALRAHDRDLSAGAFAYTTPTYDLAYSGQSENAHAIIASGRFFDVLGVPVILGRTFTEKDDVRRGGKDGPVVVVSYAFWQRHFGGAADVIGKPLVLNRVTLTVIGVTPPEFTGLEQGQTFDVAVPLGLEPLMRGSAESALDHRSWWWLRVMARTKPGQSVEQVTTALRGVQPQLRQATLPDDWRPDDLARYLAEPFNARPAANGPASLARVYQQPLFTLMAVVAMVLLIACANIANLLLARAGARRHELSVRLALGASRARIARQLIAESLLLSTTGAFLGLLFAQWGSSLLVRQLSSETETITIDLSLDWRVLGFTAGVAAVTALIFGTVPALRGTRVEPHEAIKAQGRSILGESRFGFGSLLVVGQIALSLVLVVGGGLFLQSFARLASVRLGYDANPILVASINASRSRVPAGDQPAMYNRIRDAVMTVPGVTSAAASVITPITNSEWNTEIDNFPGQSLPRAERIVWMNEMTPGWFATYGTPILAGRDVTARDTASSPRVALVNEAFARKFFDGANPIGKIVREIAAPGEPAPPFEIVGLVKDAIYLSPREGVPPTMYRAMLQKNQGHAFNTDLAVRVAGGSPALATRAVADAIMRVDPDLSLTFHSFAQDVRAVTAQERVVALLSGFFGGLALLLAGLGLYGVMSYAVGRRRTEIGLRMALGARPAAAVFLVLRRVGLLVLLGVIAGTALSLWASHFVSSLLFGLAPRDSRTLAGAVLVLATIGALAGWLPARRAARIDPARVLREG
ncbi:MAG TPA: ABC transporter permease [Vicinamibacterales bacterium]